MPGREALPQRSGYVLPPTALVIRGGEMLDGDLRRAAVKCLRLYGVLGLSVVAADVETAEELARRGRRRLETYSVIHVCRARSLGAPYELLPTWAAPHYTLRIPGVEPGHLASLRARFDRIANPLVRGP